MDIQWERMAAIWWGGGRTPLDLTKCLSAVTDLESNISEMQGSTTERHSTPSQQLQNSTHYNINNATATGKVHKLHSFCLNYKHPYFDKHCS